MPTYKWKPGDKVALIQNHIVVPVKRTVERVTPSGVAYLKGDATSQYRPDGYKRGQTGWEHSHIEPWTEAHEAKVLDAYRKRMKHVMDANFAKVPKPIMRLILGEILQSLQDSPGDAT